MNKGLVTKKWFNRPRRGRQMTALSSSVPGEHTKTHISPLSEGTFVKKKFIKYSYGRQVIYRVNVNISQMGV